MKFGEKLKQILSKTWDAVGPEVCRLAVQGRAELGSVLFTGQGYVPYGQGQNTKNAEHGMEGLHGNGKNEVQRESEGRSM